MTLKHNHNSYADKAFTNAKDRCFSVTPTLDRNPETFLANLVVLKQAASLQKLSTIHVYSVTKTLQRKQFNLLLKIENS